MKNTILLLFAFITIQVNAQNKSYNVEINNGVFVVKHSVKAKETLYAISKIYNVNIDEIKKFNKLKTDELTVNSGIFIPFQTSKINYSKGDKLIYTIKKGDTYNAIVVKQKLNLKEVKKLNKATDDNLKLGQKLIIGFWNNENNAETEVVNKEKEEDKSKELKPETKKKEEKTTEDKKTTETLKSNENKGWAMCLPTDTKVDKNYALHNSAKIGSMIKVKNIKNNKVISAKVLGRIPANVNDVLVLLSGNSAEDLGVKNEKFEVIVIE